MAFCINKTTNISYRKFLKVGILKQDNICRASKQLFFAAKLKCLLFDVFYQISDEFLL